MPFRNFLHPGSRATRWSEARHHAGRRQTRGHKRRTILEGENMAVELFYITSRIYLYGYKNVPVTWFVTKRERPLFGRNGSLGIPYAYVIEGYEIESGRSSEAAVEELFLADEAKSFVEFLYGHYGDAYRR